MCLFNIMSSYVSFRFFCIFIYFILSTSSQNFIPKKFIKNLSGVLEHPIPNTPSECSSLFDEIVMRYYPDRKAEEVKIEILRKQGKDSTLDESRQWRIIFNEIENNFKQIEEFLIANKLSNIPKNKAEWELVIDIMNKSSENIFDTEQKQKLKLLIISKQAISIDEYPEALQKFAIIYKTIPPSKEIGFAQKFLELEDSKFYGIGFKKVAEKLSAGLIKLMKICKKYACAFKIRQFIEMFIPKHYAGNGDLKRIESIITSFSEEGPRRYKDLINYYRHLVSLTTKSTKPGTDDVFKTWNNLWKKKLEFDVYVNEVTMNAQVARGLEEAILRIWNAPDADEALKLWKQDYSIWNKKTNVISVDDQPVFLKLAKPTRNNLRLLTLSTSASLKDVEYAITLFENDYKNINRYTECIWILTYRETDLYINQLRNEFNRMLPETPDNITRNHLFCYKLSELWTATSILDFHSKDTQNLPPQCEPTAVDYEQYISTLGEEPGNSGIIDLIRVIMHLGPRPTFPEHPLTEAANV